MSGTNAHVVLEEPPLGMADTPSSFVRPIHVLTLSARSDKALMELSKNYAVTLSDSAASLQDVCFTANTGRFPFAHRLAVLGGSTNEICEKLTAFAKGDHAQGVFGGLAVKGSLRIVFLFTGQGSQYVGMGRQLYDTQPTFRKTLEQCDEILRPYLDESLLEVLYPELEQHQASRVSLLLDQTMYTQPALFSLEYALAMLWKSWGIWPPAIVMGHSVGEYVAACIAGLFSLEDGLKLVAQRGRLIQQHLTQQGQMAVVFTPYKNLTETIKPYSHDVSIAAINGHKNTVISGTSHAVLSVLNQLKAQGIKCMTLPVSHAFHSPLVEPILEQFRQFATEVTYHIPKIDIISNVTGGQVKHEMMNHEYWCRHMREPVRFAESMQLLYQDGYRVFVEIGPSPVLLGMGRGCMPENIGQDKETPFQWLPTLRQGRQDWQQLLESLAQLYLCGASVDWAAFDENYPRKRVVLPTYPFERQRYWVEPVYVKSQDVLASTQDTAFWLDKVDIKRLIQLMEKTGRFSKEQLELVEIIAEHEEAWNVGDLLYQIAWPSRPRRQKIRHVFDKIKIEAGQWLILADKGGMGEAVATLLTQHGQTCLIAYAGHSYESLGNYHWQARPARRADFERLFQEVSKHQELPLRGVIHLWGLDALKAEDLTLSSVAMGCGSLVYLVQCLTEHNGSAARLWLGTRGAVAVGESGETLSLPQTPLWGLGKVIVLEHPEHWGGMIDLDPKSSPEDGLYFLTEVLDSEGEDFLALRHGQRYVPRLVRTNLPVVQGQGIRHDGTYLITGGLGFLGLKIAQWMIQQGCQHIVLTGRHVACTKETQDAVHQMEQKAEVRLIQADVSVKQDMARVFEEIKTHMPPLRGIIHAAGMGKYQNIKDMDQQSIEAVLRAKVTGAWIVHELSSQMNLDFFLCLSSIASVWGSKGQGHYAAANHFLDTLAHYRHKLGLPGLTVNLGPFLDGGMTSTDDLTLLKHMGVKALPSKQSIEALGYLLDTDCIQMTMAKVDWSILKGLFEVRKKHLFFESIDGTHQQKPEVQKTGQGSEILQKLKAAPIKEQPEILIHYLQGEVASILELGLSSLPDIDQGLFEMGMDSLMVVELKNRLETALETTLPSTLAFDYPNINSLARYLWKKVPAEEQPKEVSGETQQSNTSYEELSLDEVEAAITEKVLALENLLKNSY
jgi:acyl transferase domain-containing protein/acyl carrier protein